MNLDARLARYIGRDFSIEQARILVLMEEAAVALFAALPKHFVMFGGATLVLFRNSPRLSKDLDLFARVDRLPSPEELQNALEERVQEVAGILGVGPVTFEREQNGENFLRLWITGSNGQRLFTVDLTRIGGSVLAREIVDEKIVLDEHCADPNRFAELPAFAKGGIPPLAKDPESERRLRHTLIARSGSGAGWDAEGPFERSPDVA